MYIHKSVVHMSIIILKRKIINKTLAIQYSFKRIKHCAQVQSISRMRRGVHIRKYINIILHTNKWGESHIITLIDTKKAFNKTECLFLVFQKKKAPVQSIKGCFIVVPHNKRHKLNASTLLDGKKWDLIREKINLEDLASRVWKLKKRNQNYYHVYIFTVFYLEKFQRINGKSKRKAKSFASYKMNILNCFLI